MFLCNLQIFWVKNLWDNNIEVHMHFYQLNRAVHSSVPKANVRDCDCRLQYWGAKLNFLVQLNRKKNNQTPAFFNCTPKKYISVTYFSKNVSLSWCWKYFLLASILLSRLYLVHRSKIYKKNCPPNIEFVHYKLTYVFLSFYPQNEFNTLNTCKFSIR